ncbi:unnamed protein product [Hyaloperonospora brassicae]|uniref:Uncharacterized protein n=1 Tax=Hyaloperonospora brassicae TaxID=162125 RepID=A0AAV0SWQ9_HYABA|nr:unnamed protein product [Hyaloperonospora brassicae]
MRVRPTKLRAIALLCGVALSPTASSHEAVDASSLLSLHASDDPAPVWAQYERYLLSKTRATPLLLHFTSGSTCYSDSGDAGDPKDEDDQKRDIGALEELREADQRACEEHEKSVEAAVTRAAASWRGPQVSVVRVDVHVWPSMLYYHMVSSTPSLLWIPGRASGHFQRYPHVDTNFLDLNASALLLSAPFGESGGTEMEDKEQVEHVQHAEMVENAVANEVAAFVRQCQERSGYLVRDARGNLVPATPVSYDDSTFTGLDMIPVVAFVAFVVFVVYENKEFVVGVLQMRCFWFVLCSGIVYVAFSGLFHSVIHRRPWYYFGQMHGLVFVYPSSRQQFVLEGLVNGTWSFWLSLGAMSVSDVFPTLRSRLAREDIIRWSLLLVSVSYMALYLAYSIKYRWMMM